jgi:hypothetical protein
LTLINLLEDFFVIFMSQKRRPMCGKSSPSMRLAAIKVKALTLASSMLLFLRPIFASWLSERFFGLVPHKDVSMLCETVLRRLAVAVCCALVGLNLCGVVAAEAAGAAEEQPVTFYKNVLPLLQKNCQSCHRPGEVAPMPLRTFEETRPYARAIKKAVLAKKMPPWFADETPGHFRNERRLTEAEIGTLVNWVDNGAMAGEPKDGPAPIAFVEGWNIKPDVILEMPRAHEVPASGTIDYTYYVLPTHFDHDVWVRAVEIRPGNRAVVHHIIASVRPPGSQSLKRAKPGEPFLPSASEQKELPSTSEYLATYLPGLEAQQFDAATPDTARLIPAGSDIVFEIHYVTNGRAGSDRSKIGFTVVDHAPKYIYYEFTAGNNAIEIPPGEPHYESRASLIINQPARLVWLFPHMHLRGTDFRYTAVYPSGKSEILLNVPKYDFGWQVGYQEAQPILLPKGTRIDCVAHYDNSSNNKSNPNPGVTVRYGQQSWDEMMNGWFAVVVDAKVKPGGIILWPSRIPGVDWLRSLIPVESSSRQTPGDLSAPWRR